MLTCTRRSCRLTSALRFSRCLRFRSCSNGLWRVPTVRVLVGSTKTSTSCSSNRTRLKTITCSALSAYSNTASLTVDLRSAKITSDRWQAVGSDFETGTPFQASESFARRTSLKTLRATACTRALSLTPTMGSRSSAYRLSPPCTLTPTRTLPTRNTSRRSLMRSLKLSTQNSTLSFSNVRSSTVNGYGTVQ